MFETVDRERLRAELVAVAEADPRVTGIALFGSAARDAEDRWSDVDLALGVAGDDVGPVLADLTERMYARHGALDHLDVGRGGATYRVFLLASTLQVDLAVAPEAGFGAEGPAFRLLRGRVADRPPRAFPDAHEHLALGWLYALHARSSLERGRAWQAEYMISAVRDQVLALACVRHGLPAYEGRGLHELPPEVTVPVEGALVRSLEAAELRRASRAAGDVLLAEARLADPALAERLAPVLRELAGWQSPPP